MIGFVRIERSSRSKMWYEKLIGELWPVYADEGVEWETYEFTGHKNYILKEDATYVTDGQIAKDK